MEKVKFYFLETRPQFLLLSVILVFLGLSTALLLGNSVSAFSFILALTGLILLHISTNVLNDYFDYKSGIDLNTEMTPFNGGSGFISSGLLSTKNVFVFGIVTFLLAIPIGIYFLHIVGLSILPIFILGAIFVLFYTPLLTKTGYGISEISAGLGLGTLPVYGTFVILTGSYSPTALIYSIPSGLLVANLLILNEIPDIEADKIGKRKTLAIQLGAIPVFNLYLFIDALSYLWIIFFTSTGNLPILSLLSLLTIPAYIKIILHGKKLINSPEFAKIQGLNIIVVLFTQLLFALGLLINYFIV